MPDSTLTWTAKRWGWHIADSKALPGAMYSVMPCADGYQLHRRLGEDCYVWGAIFDTAVEAKRTAQAWENRTAQSVPQPAAAGSVGP